MARVVIARQFDVFANPSARGLRERPFLVVIQSDLLGTRRTRVVVPLIVKTEITPIPRLNPIFRVQGRELHFHPLELAHIPNELLRNPLANLEAERDRIVAALDMVFTGI
jgi:toxin CcdB